MGEMKFYQFIKIWYWLCPKNVNFLNNQILIIFVLAKYYYNKNLENKKNKRVKNLLNNEIINLLFEKLF